MTSRTAAAVLWTYKDPENGKTFYLEEKVVSWHSPWSGKVHTGEKPERYSMSAVTKDMKEDKLSRLWSYDAPEGKLYTEEKLVRPRSPWNGKAFKVEKQERKTVTDVAKALKDDGSEEIKTAAWKVAAEIKTADWKVEAEVTPDMWKVD